MKLFEVEEVTDDFYYPVETIGFFTSFLVAEKYMRQCAKNNSFSSQYSITVYEAINGHYVPKYNVHYDTKGQKTEYEEFETA